jgi:hypothetical protein
MILFRSLLTKPTVAPKNAVEAPISVITNKAVVLYSNIGEDLNNRYIPAVTRVQNPINLKLEVKLIRLDYILLLKIKYIFV